MVWPGSRRRQRVSTVAALTVLIAVVGLSACDAARDEASGEFQPIRPGVLRVAADLPAPGFWDGDDPATVDAGFEWGLATALADRFDLRLEVVDVPFARIEAGDLGGADLALAQLSDTPERRRVLDVSLPYYTTRVGVVVRRGETVADLATARDLTWAVREATTEETFVVDVIRPAATPVVVATEEEAVARVADGAVEAALMDLPTALVLAASDPQVEVVASFAESQRYVVGLPQGSPNRRLVDSAIRALRADGTLADLEADELQPALGVDPATIPFIRSRS